MRTAEQLRAEPPPSEKKRRWTPPFYLKGGEGGGKRGYLWPKRNKLYLINREEKGKNSRSPGKKKKLIVPEHIYVRRCKERGEERKEETRGSYSGFWGGGHWPNLFFSCLGRQQQTRYQTFSIGPATKKKRDEKPRRYREGPFYGRESNSWEEEKKRTGRKKDVRRPTRCGGCLKKKVGGVSSPWNKGGSP